MTVSAARLRTPWWWVCGLLTVISLGLPWTKPLAGTFLPGYAVPGFSSVNYADGTVDLQPGIFVPGLLTSATDGSAGYQTDLRVLLLGTALLVFFGVRRRSVGLCTAGVALAVLTLPLIGLAVTSGVVVYLGALACLVIALHHAGLHNAGLLARRVFV